MNISVVLDPVSLARLRRKLQPGLVLEPAERLVTDISNYASAQAEAGAPRDTGAIARSFMPTPQGLLARVKVSAAALPVSGGRRAGAPMPPPAALRGWTERHGLVGLEFVIARAIARRGIRGRFFIGRARQKLRNEELPRLLARAAHEIEAIWSGS